MLYLTLDELKELVVAVESRQHGDTKNLVFGHTPVLDANGDTLGWIGMTDGGEYGFIIKMED